MTEEEWAALNKDIEEDCHTTLRLIDQLRKCTEHKHDSDLLNSLERSTADVLVAIHESPSPDE